jgi:hypothetical protein
MNAMTSLCIDENSDDCFCFFDNRAINQIYCTTSAQLLHLVDMNLDCDPGTLCVVEICCCDENVCRVNCRDEGFCVLCFHNLEREMK